MKQSNNVYQLVDKKLIKNHFEAIVDSSDDAIISKTLDGLVMSWNKGAERIFGYKAEEIIGKPMSTIFPKDRLDEETMILGKIGAGEAVEHFKTIRLHKDGHEIHISATISPIKNSSGKIIGASNIARDITQQEHDAAIVSNYKAIIDSSDDAIISKTLDGIIMSWNNGAEKVFGYSSDEMIGKPMATVFPKDRLHEETMILAKIAAGETVDHFKTVRIHKDGHEIHVSATISPVKDKSGKIIGASKIARDISEQIQYENMLLRYAQYDALTGLPNRRYFMQILAQQLKNSEVKKEACALLYLDLDKFKAVNDQLGHDFGDAVLKQVSSTLLNVLRKMDTACRLGGDEFLVLLPFISERKNAEKIALKIISELNRGFRYKETNIEIHCSIGISIFPDLASNQDQLLRTADRALYEVKNNSKDNYQVFHEEIIGTLDKNRNLRADLPWSIERNELRLLFQPIIEMKTGKVKKAEALIRWEHPEYGTVSPMEFIPIAEDTKFIHQIGDWVFYDALNKLASWKSKYGTNLQVSINKSPIQFLEDSSSYISWPEKIKKAGLSTSNILIEITESSLMNQTSITKNKLFAFQREGIQVAIDDFGTGYSCLAYLNQFDIDYIKIDKSFVSDITNNEDSRHLCEAIIAMAHKLKLMVVAEGVETEEQKEQLLNMECDYCQGYFFARPLAEKDFLKYMESGPNQME